MNLRVQGLDPAVHHFREAGEVGDFNHCDALVPEQPAGPAGGENLNAACGKCFGKLNNAGFV